MTSVNALFPSNFLKAEDFPQPRVVSIHRLEMQEINDNGGKTQKPVLFFNELGDRSLVLNKTNAGRIAEFLGDNVEGWPRQYVELYVEMVDFQGKRVPAIRARRPQQQQGYQQPPQQAQQPMAGVPAGYPPQQPQQGYQQPPAQGQPQYYNGQGQAVQPPHQPAQQPQQGPAVGVPLDDKIPFFRCDL